MPLILTLTVCDTEIPSDFELTIFHFKVNEAKKVISNFLAQSWSCFQWAHHTHAFSYLTEMNGEIWVLAEH